jgi:hypothetical protein
MVKIIRMERLALCLSVRKGSCGARTVRCDSTPVLSAGLGRKSVHIARICSTATTSTRTA